MVIRIWYDPQRLWVLDFSFDNGSTFYYVDSYSGFKSYVEVLTAKATLIASFN